MGPHTNGFSEDRYQGATVGCTLFVALFKAFEQEVGKEHALAVVRKVAESFGTNFAQQMKQRVGGRVPTATEMAEFAMTEGTNFGCKVAQEDHPNSVKSTYENCPFAGAFAALGLDRDAGYEFCKAFGMTMNATMCKEVGWAFEVTEYRKNWQGTCEEVMRPRHVD